MQRWWRRPNPDHLEVSIRPASTAGNTSRLGSNAHLHIAGTIRSAWTCCPGRRIKVCSPAPNAPVPCLNRRAMCSQLSSSNGTVASNGLCWRVLPGLRTARYAVCISSSSVLPNCRSATVSAPFSSPAVDRPVFVAMRFQRRRWPDRYTGEEACRPRTERPINPVQNCGCHVGRGCFGGGCECGHHGMSRLPELPLTLGTLCRRVGVGPARQGLALP